MSPTHYRSGGVQEVLTFAVGQCSLGAILVRRAPVAAILLGDDPDTLVRDLGPAFPRARLVGGDAACRATGGAGGRAGRGGGSWPRLAARCSRHRLPATRVAGAVARFRPNDGHLHEHRRVDRSPPARCVRSPEPVLPIAHAVAIPCHRVVRTDDLWAIAGASSASASCSRASSARMSTLGHARRLGEAGRRAGARPRWSRLVDLDPAPRVGAPGLLHRGRVR